MRRLPASPVLLVLALLFLGPEAVPSARAGEPDRGRPLRDARRREGERQHRLQAALIRADANRRCAEHLVRLAEDLLRRLAEARAADAPALALLRSHNTALHEEVAGLQEDLRAEQQRHVESVTDLQDQIVSAYASAEDARLGLVRAQNAAAAAETRRRIEGQEVERLRWIFAQEAPRESVARVLGNIPAPHWRAELQSADPLRARVALQVLAVLPDASPETVEAILQAARGDRSLLDAAAGPLVRIGGPAVQPLVAAGCGEDAGMSLDRGWVLHVLGRMGSNATDAIPWLEDLAAGEGREAAQARRALEKIRAR